MRLLKLVTLLLFIASMIGCESETPQAYTFELAIKEESIAQGDSVLQVKQDDKVTIVVTADKPITFHLHGYNIEKEARPGEPAILGFIANATGSFPFTAHMGTNGAHMHSDESEDIELGRLVVEPR